MSKFRQLLLFIIFVGLSIFIGFEVKNKTINFNNSIINFFSNTKDIVVFKISKHFNQAATIERLESENLELKKNSVLLNTFAYELNQILEDSSSLKFAPNISLARTLSYVSIGDYTKFWVEFTTPQNNLEKNSTTLDKSKIYGSISNGNTAGIVVFKDENPMLILQNDPKSSFSVYIGEPEIPGVATGDGINVVVKFIPRYLDPKVGDAVYTSGQDSIFFAGIPVGVIREIIDEDVYKSAVIEPNFKELTPAFLYIITKER